jgi:fucose permease
MICLSCVLLSNSLAPLLAGTFILGLCIAPLFPLLLSGALACGFSTHTMAVMLASCALGSAALPLLLGMLSSVSSLHIGMALPLLGFGCLIFLRWNQPQRCASPA